MLSKQHLWKKKGFENVQILVGDVRIENVTILVIAVDDQPLVFSQEQYSIGIPGK